MATNTLIAGAYLSAVLRVCARANAATMGSLGAGGSASSALAPLERWLTRAGVGRPAATVLDVLLQLNYHGVAFAGWQQQQRQPDADSAGTGEVAGPGAGNSRTVEVAVMAGVERALGVARPPVLALSRTDAGVSARDQAVRFRVPAASLVAAGCTNPGAVLAAFNACAHPAVAAVRARFARPSQVVLRAASTSKTYAYYVATGAYPGAAPLQPFAVYVARLDVGAMRAALAGVVGTHDFAPAFAAPRKPSPAALARAAARSSAVAAPASTAARDGGSDGDDGSDADGGSDAIGGSDAVGGSDGGSDDDARGRGGTSALPQLQAAELSSAAAPSATASSHAAHGASLEMTSGGCCGVVVDAPLAAVAAAPPLLSGSPPRCGATVRTVSRATLDVLDPSQCDFALVGRPHVGAWRVTAGAKRRGNRPGAVAETAATVSTAMAAAAAAAARAGFSGAASADAACGPAEPGIDGAPSTRAAAAGDGEAAAGAASALVVAPPDASASASAVPTPASDGATVVLRITFEGDGFLRHQVRRLVGALLAVGRGTLPPDYVAHTLREQSGGGGAGGGSAPGAAPLGAGRGRRTPFGAAPGRGLWLESQGLPDELWSDPDFCNNQTPGYVEDWGLVPGGRNAA